MRRRPIQNRAHVQNEDIQYDVHRAFPIKVNYSNLQHHGVAPNYSMTLADLTALRSQLPVKRGVYTTHGVTQSDIIQHGDGIIDDVRNYGRRGVKYVRNKAGDVIEYAGNSGIDYAANYGKQRVGSVAKRVRGDGFFRKVLSGGVRLAGNAIGDAIGGSVYEGARPANYGPRRRPAKGLVFTPEQEMAIASAQNGNGFFSKLASGGVRLAGNAIADAIGGNVKPKRRRRKGAGLVAPGMVR